VATPSSGSDSEVTAHEREKLLLEISALRAREAWERTAGRLISVTSAVILVAGFLVGLSQYRDAKKQEYSRRFWEKRLEIYSAISTAAARTATTRDSAGRSKAYQAFLELYHGPFVLITDDSAAMAAKNFSNTYIDFSANPRREADLPVAARALSVAARRALARASEGLLDVSGLTAY
jgi:hypothetical protein